MTLSGTSSVSSRPTSAASSRTATASCRPAPRLPRSERLEQRLLFAAVVRSGAGVNHDAVWNVQRQFEADLGGVFANRNSIVSAGNAGLTGWREVEWRENPGAVPGGAVPR